LKKAVHFGAGNIGRGFLGQLYFESGYDTTFVDVVEEVVSALHARRGYPLRIVEETETTLQIGRVDAVNGNDLDAVARALAEADIASTAVGVNVLPHIAGAIARGIERRFSAPNPPLNIIVCENLIHAGSYLREQVRAHLAPHLHAALDEKVGFVEASIGRMVPVMTNAQKAEDSLLVCVEPYCELPVDANGFKGPVPEIAHMKALPNFGAYVERKLFVHNLSHAATAYLGYLRGHEFIWQAIRDDQVRAAVDAATAESCRALAHKHGLDKAGLDAHRADLIRRYHNRALGDQVARVARDPMRKLGPNDRLIGAARMCLDQGMDPEHIAYVAAAALRYDAADDPSAQNIQSIRKERGIDGILREICQVGPDSRLAALIGQGTERLRNEGWIM
jgi:mannitol-1-phosphate 5-dehydrogenase